MYPVSDRFLRAITQPHTIVTAGTYTVPGGEPVPLRFRAEASSVILDTASRVRRRASLSVLASRDEFDAMTTPGCLFEVQHGIRYSSTNTEMVPVFYGELTKGERPRGRGAGGVDLPLQDMWGRIARADFVTPFTIAGGTSRAAAIAAIAVDAWATVTIDDRSRGGGTVAGGRVWSGSRSDAIADLATDGGLVVYFDGAGQLVIENRPTSSARAVWSVSTLTELVQTRPLDKPYNIVVVKPSAVDGSQTWEPQIAQVTDPSHPRHPDKIGPVPYVWASPTAGTAAAAMQAAQSILYRLLGSTETLKLGTLSNPALEGLDVIRVTTPRLGRELAETFSHFVDGYNMNLATGEMVATTRKQALDG